MASRTGEYSCGCKPFPQFAHTSLHLPIPFFGEITAIITRHNKILAIGIRF
ncbi:MAG: hypothetical protein JWL69_1554, partial [Phycisphaerales bacterium]|nr:hypothetical protein [Phycisphaerales bacterium]